MRVIFTSALFLKTIKHFCFIDVTLSEIFFEKLLGQRDFYLNTLKHLNFQTMTDPSNKELEDIEIMKTKTIEQLKKSGTGTWIPFI